MTNQIRSFLLLTAMTILIVLAGQLIGGRNGMMFALVIAAALNFFSYWYSDKMVLKLYRARPVEPREAPELHEIVRTISERSGLPMPKICLIPSEAPNAFATGRNPQHAVVAVTQGLVRLLDREELTGVLAHEMAHVRNRDILVGTIAATMAGAIMMLASLARWSALFGGSSGDNDEGGLGPLGLILMSVIAPMAAMIIQMAISRSREYMADSTGAQFAGTPEGLARALEKLGAYSSAKPMAASAATAHLFTVSPLSGSGLMKLFSTHPPISERIARLRGSSFSGGTRSPDADARISEARSSWNRLSQ
ncbi:MAG: zinc metalloprotease HtpX [Desulfobacterales bacterium]|jgi:heat shock protein HtpX|nr:zinc metalloprotease HtpX [Desulfobacterales bacterium]